ncbi:helix-turn-helix domain-containing protein [Ferrimonas senticii]|uniref:helix-turn-helix domain-containing protein n=1 Tax=Ferrimonas senticii TaxID=394566 RepID=UPI000A070138
MDWHPADIRAALEKNGTNMAEIARANGIAPPTIRAVQNRKYERGQQLIAAALNKDPREIWPSRYRKEGSAT